MAVFRIEKNKNYTVMANYHLRDISLSLKAKGLLSLMLSLPEGWDYTTKGLACICKDGVDSICSTVKELEKAGYVQRRRLRNELGHLTEIEYTILEKPVRPSSSENLPQPDNSANTGTPPKREKPVLGYPVLDNPEQAFPEQASPAQDEPEQEKPAQLNIQESITEAVMQTDSKKELVTAKKRIAELDNFIKKLYEGNASGKIPDRQFEKLMAQYDTEQQELEASVL